MSDVQRLLPHSSSDLTINEIEGWLRLRERRNVERVQQIDLIGELATTPDELDRIGRALRRIIASYGPAMGTRWIVRTCPITLAEFLVAAGVAEYRQGDFWSPVVERTGIPRQNYQTEWGRTFERTVERSGLETFPDFSLEGASRYVSRILAHGGIPTYSLTDFFERLLMPVAKHLALTQLTPGDLITQWQLNPAVFVGVDEPVRRFLLNGGAVAHDFVGRCLEMAARSQRDGEIPSALDLGLPERIVEHFARWLARVPIAIIPNVTERRQRIAKPVLTYDPWAGDAFVVELPEEPLRTGVTWSVVAAPWSRRLDVSAPRSGDRTRSVEIGIPVRFASLEATLESDDVPLRRWVFRGLSDERPVLAFRVDNGQAIDWKDALPPMEMFLVAPSRSRLSAMEAGTEVELAIREELPWLAGEWSGFRGWHVDLTNSEQLNVASVTGAQTVAIPIRDEATPDRPHLAGLTELAIQLPDDSSLISVGTIPRVILPLIGRNGARFSEDRWRLSLRSLPQSIPQIDRSFVPGEIRSGQADEDRFTTVDLSHNALLGPSPIGRFELTAKGPLGRDARFEFGILPALSITGQDSLLVPTHDGTQAAQVLIRVDGHVVKTPDAEDVSLQSLGAGAYRLTVNGAHRSVPVAISHPTLDAEVEVTIPLNRLTWTVADLTGPQMRTGMTDRVIDLARDVLAQSGGLALVVDPGNADPATRLRLVMRDLAGRVLYQYPDRPATGRRRFALRELLDTLATRPESHLNLDIEVESSANGTVSCRRFPAITLTKRLAVDSLRVSDRLTGAIRQVQLTWNEASPVTNRVVRFWSLWRLWEHPRQYPIPAEARGSWSFQDARSLLPGGEYRVELVVVDPWREQMPTELPDLNASSGKDVHLGTAEEWADYLDDLPDNAKGTLERFLARRHAPLLQRLRTIADDEMEPVIRAMTGLIAVDDANALSDETSLAVAMGELRETLVDRAGFWTTVAELSGFDQKQDDRLRRLVVELGLLHNQTAALGIDEIAPAKRETLARLWAPLLWVFWHDAIKAGDANARAFAETLLGRSLDETPVTQARLDQPGSARRHRSPRMVGGPEYAFNPTQLRQFRTMLDLMPRGVISDAKWQLATFDWLIRVRENSALEFRALLWIAECRFAAADDLSALDGRGLDAVTGELRQRRPSGGSDELLMLPYLVGATALMERALARGIVDRSALLSEMGRGQHSPRLAFEFAVELYTHDLCLMDLLLHQQATRLVTHA